MRSSKRFTNLLTLRVSLGLQTVEIQTCGWEGGVTVAWADGVTAEWADGVTAEWVGGVTVGRACGVTVDRADGVTGGGGARYVQQRES